MNNFIEQNKKLLLFYYRAARIGGWIFLALASAAIIGHSIALISRLGDVNEFHRYWQHDVPWGMLNNVFPTGLLVLGVSQLIWYLLETDHKARWVLRNSYKLLYAYTVILLGYYCWVGTSDAISHFNEPHDFPWRMILLVVFIIVKLLALVGLAEISRRLLPVIEEHKSLV